MTREEAAMHEDAVHAEKTVVECLRVVDRLPPAARAQVQAAVDELAEFVEETERATTILQLAPTGGEA